MSVGANSIKRAAKTANTAAEPKKTKVSAVNETQQKEEKTNPEEKPKIGQSKAPAKSSGKTEKKIQEKSAKKPAKKPEETLETEKTNKKDTKNEKEAKSNYEAYGIGQQLPVHLL